MTSMQLGKVVCELCRRVENGEPLTPEAIRQYRESKMGVMGVTMINVPPPEDRGPQINPVRSMGNGFMRALGFDKTSAPTQAEIVVQEKQRGRLFEEVDLEKTLGDGESLGTMQEMNQMFEENERD